MTQVHGRAEVALRAAAHVSYRIYPAQSIPSGPKLTFNCLTELASHIRLLAIPFAPVIIARAAGALIAQTYISSYPASALLLISPPPSNAALAASIPGQSLLPTALPEFDFEPRFPVAVLATEDERSVLEKESRLWRDPGVDKMVVGRETGLTGQEGLARIEEWLDELGF